MSGLVHSRPSTTDADRAFELERQVVDGCRAIRQAWILLAGYLSEMQRDELCRSLGYDTFTEWLASPEISLSRSHAYALIGAYREFVIEHGLNVELVGAVEASKLAVTLPAVRAELVSADQALDDATSLSRSDLREKYRDPTARLNTEKERPICPSCGQLLPEEAA